MKIRLKALTQLLAPAFALSPLGGSANHASPSGTAATPHYAAKHATAKRPPAGRPARAGAARVAAPQGGGLSDLTP